jgi:hypothetical protein
MTTANLYLSIDLSSTGAKVLYGTNPHAMFPTVYHPQTIELNRKLSPQDYPDLPDCFLIRFKHRTYLTGLAAYIYLRGAIGLRESKADRAVPQILTAIADAVQKCGVEPSNINVDIRCLLPAGEISGDRHRLEAELTAAARRFYARNVSHKCTIASFTCKPEGAGLYKQFFELSTTPPTSIGILQLGYRNAGFFALIDGAPVRYRSPQLGLSVLVREFQNTIGYPDETESIAPISEAIEIGDSRKLAALVNRSTKDLDKILTKVTNTYIALLRRDIAEHMQTVETLIVGGGTAQTVRKYLRECLPTDLKLSLHSGLGRAWDYPNSLQQKLSPNLYYRFADIFCYSQYADTDNGCILRPIENIKATVSRG